MRACAALLAAHLEHRDLLAYLQAVEIARCHATWVYLERDVKLTSPLGRHRVGLGLVEVRDANFDDITTVDSYAKRAGC